MVSIPCLRDDLRVAACVTMMCLIASALGCAASPADDRRRLNPAGLRDAGRDDDYDDDEGDDEAVSAPRRGRDAAADARVQGAGDAGGAAATRPRDAGALLARLR